MGEQQKLVIKEWAVEDRPREKMIEHGARALSDSELLAILIGSGNREETAVELSRRILKKADNNLNALGRLSINDLTSTFKGIGEAKAVTIVAALELGRRRREEEKPQQQQIRSSRNVFDVFQPIVGDLLHEECWALFLNPSNAVVHKAKICQGGINTTSVDIRLILKIAFEKLATGIALCHNHPSGNLHPSVMDVELTKKIKNACKMVDIAFLDHIIVGGNHYFSFADEDKL